MPENSVAALTTPARRRILIADDEQTIRELLAELLGDDHDCQTVCSSEEALARLAGESFDLILSDIQMGGASGLEMIAPARRLAPDTVVIMVSGQANIESAIEAMRAGAFDYVTKPFDFDHVEAAVKRALEHQSLLAAKRRYETHLEELVAARTAELEHEIIERVRAEEKVNRLAYYDSLTNLPNQTLFRDLLNNEIASAQINGQKAAVILTALDSFKNISDTLGHGVGDRLVRDFALRLTKTVPQTARAAYLGGGEFAVLLTGIGAAREAARAALDIKNSLDAPFLCDVHELFVTASLGISMVPDDAQDGQTLFKNAGAALNRARVTGDNYQFYTADMHHRALKRLSLEADLRRAVERREFVLYYQPQVSAATGEIVGAEALLRWRRHDGEIVAPSEFIPTIEETGMIVPLGGWILRAACRQNAEWRRAGLPRLRIAVNISLRQFRQGDLFETVSHAIETSGLEAECLELELTESSIMHDAEQAIAILNQLRRLGIRISVDDFGSGYSSLSYLKNLPIDVLKIDRSFVRDMEGENGGEAIIRTIISLAQNLRLKTVAEGVETENEAQKLSRFGCDELQGFFYSQPLAAADFEVLLRAQR